MLKNDFYSTLSELISEYFKIKNSLSKTNKEKVNNYLNIYTKICSLEANKESEKNMKNNCKIFLKRAINIEFNTENKKEEEKKEEKEEEKEEEEEEKENEQKLIIINQNEKEKLSNKININMTNNIILHNKQNKLKINKMEPKENEINEINSPITKQIEDKLNELLSNNTHIKFINKVKKNKNNEQNKYFNSIFLKLNPMNKKIFNLEIDSILFSKYFTLLYSIYPFFSYEQKKAIFKTFSPKYHFYKQLLNNIILDNENNKENNTTSDLLYDFFISKETNKVEKLEELFKKFIEASQDNISILYYSYQFLMLLIIIYNKYNEHYKLRNKLSFKLHFILSNYKSFSFNSDQFKKIFNDLLFMKHFYQTIFLKEIKEPYLIKIKDNYLLYNNYLYNNDTLDISFLFDQKDNENYKRIIGLNNGIIPHFYNINEMNNKQLIDTSSFLIKQQKDKFLDNIISLTYIKSEFIEKNFNQYKQKLINLEKEIFELAQDNLGKSNNNKINQYSTKDKEKAVYNKLVHELDKWMKDKYYNQFKNKYILYPVGSLTEFLSLGESDIDIYLFLKTENLNEKIKIFDAIYNFVRKYEEKKPAVSQRILVISIKYDNISFDLSVLGYPLYIHALLFREYSLIDSRLPMIGLAVKKLKTILDLDKEIYINSYCWMTLLVIFLQDIINPPILPKIYSEKDINKLLYQDIEFGHNKNKNYRDFFKNRFKTFFQNIKKETIPIPDCLFNKKKIIEIYKKEIGQNKNELSCAEILLKFIEFVAFYLKFDTIYAECSINGEAFLNISEIKNIYSDNKNNNIDERIKKYNNEFYNYFSKKYLKFKTRENNKTIRNGFILIRDPVDNHYNPGQKFSNENELEEFIRRLRYCYSILIKYGSFKSLSALIEKKEEDKKNNNIKY